MKSVKYLIASKCDPKTKTVIENLSGNEFNEVLAYSGIALVIPSIPILLLTIGIYIKFNSIAIVITMISTILCFRLMGLLIKHIRNTLAASNYSRENGITVDLIRFP
jgi:hypothetical protein